MYVELGLYDRKQKQKKKKQKKKQQQLIPSVGTF